MATKETVDAFCGKIGVKLPEPRRMDGFGMELPEVYLGRCMDVLIPAVESYLQRSRDAVIQSFVDDVIAYAKEKGQPGPAPAVPVKEVKVAKPRKHNGRPEWRNLPIEEKIKQVKDWLAAHPGKSVPDCADALDIVPSTAYRCLQMARAKKGASVVAASPEKKEQETVIPAPAYKEGGYMAGLRSRFENRHKETVTPAATVPAKEAVPAGKTVTPVPTVGSFFLRSHFLSLPKEIKEKALAEHWSIVNAKADDVRALDASLQKIGIRLRKNRITMLEYSALKALAENRKLSYLDKINACPDCLAKA